MGSIEVMINELEEGQYISLKFKQNDETNFLKLDLFFSAMTESLASDLPFFQTQ